MKSCGYTPVAGRGRRLSISSFMPDRQRDGDRACVAQWPSEGRQIEESGGDERELTVAFALIRNRNYVFIKCAAHCHSATRSPVLVFRTGSPRRGSALGAGAGRGQGAGVATAS